MLTGFLAAVGRRRRAVLVVALLLSAGYLLVQARVPSLGERAFPALMAVSVGCLVLGVIATARPRPTTFEVRPHPPAFSAPAQPALVFLVLAFVPMATGQAGTVVRDWNAEPFLPDHLLELAYPAVLAILILVTWRDTGVQLRPDGLRQPGLTGRLVVPWDAEPRVPTLPPAPTDRTVGLTFGRPELVRREGLFPPRRLRTDTVDPRFLCAAVRHYAARPGDRPAIGTHAEYERRMPELRGALDWSPP